MRRFLRFIYRVALWAARPDWWGGTPVPACPPASRDRCPHCGQVHPPYGATIVGDDGAFIEDWYYGLAPR